MQHLVVQQILDRIPRTRWPVEDFTHHNRVVRGIVMTQQPLGMMLAPGELRTAQQAEKEALIQRIEDFVEVVIAAFRPAESLGSARAANLLRLPRHCFAVLKALVAMVVRRADGLPVYLRNENVRDRPQNRLRSAFQQIGKTHMQLALPQPDRRIERNESPEAYMEGRHWRARPQRPILLLKNGNNVRSH